MSQIELALRDWLCNLPTESAPKGFNAVVIKKTTIGCQIWIDGLKRKVDVGDYVKVVDWENTAYPYLRIISIDPNGQTFRQNIEKDSIIRLK